MGIYDPTVGSGGMLIQCSQYVSEQGGDGTDLDSTGRDSDGGVVSIAKMNLILHNLQSRTSSSQHVEEPHNVKDGQLIQFDRVIAIRPSRKTGHSRAANARSASSMDMLHRRERRPTSCSSSTCWPV